MRKSESHEPQSLESVMRELFGRMGLPDPGLIETLRAEWDELAGEPWRTRSHPAFLRQGELVVQVAAPSMVALLRYATGDLLRRLDARFGEGVVATVRVIVSPPRGGTPL